MDDLTALSSKTIKKIVSIVRMVYVRYRKRHQLTANPTDGVKIVLPDDDPDPYTLADIEQLFACRNAERESELNGAEFAVWAGPRPSERQIDLLQPAMDALTRQYEISGHLPADRD